MMNYQKFKINMVLVVKYCFYKILKNLWKTKIDEVIKILMKCKNNNKLSEVYEKYELWSWNSVFGKKK